MEARAGIEPLYALRIDFKFSPVRQRCVLSAISMREVFGENGGTSRNRTGVHGFAIRCIATLPSRQISMIYNLIFIARSSILEGSV